MLLQFCSERTYIFYISFLHLQFQEYTFLNLSCKQVAAEYFSMLNWGCERVESRTISSVQKTNRLLNTFIIIQ